METFGKVIKVTETRRGMSDMGAWARQDVVVETAGEYPRTVAFLVSNVALIDKFSAGQQVRVTWWVNSREYNGRWYTDAKATNIELVQAGGGAQAQPQTEAKAAAPAKKSETTSCKAAKVDDNLPF